MMIAKFRIGQQAQIKQGGDLVTIHGAIIPDFSDLTNPPKEKVCYAVTYNDGSRSEIDSFDEDELEAIGEKPDLSLVTYEVLGRKCLAIHSLTQARYSEGTKVIVLQGKEVSLLARRSDGSAIESTQLVYRIIDFSSDSADLLYNNAYKVYGYGLVIQTPEYGFQAHTVLVNDNLQENISDYSDVPF